MQKCKINVNTLFEIKTSKRTENEEKLRLRALVIKRKALCASHYVFLKSFCSLRSFVFTSFMKTKKKVIWSKIYFKENERLLCCVLMVCEMWVNLLQVKTHFKLNTCKRSQVQIVGGVWSHVRANWRKNRKRFNKRVTVLKYNCILNSFWKLFLL